jgi:integrase
VAVAALPTAAGKAALAAAQALARNAAAPATLRAYRADWAHFSQWCAARGVRARPRRPGHRRRLSRRPRRNPCAEHDPPAHRGARENAPLNDLPWNPAHRDIQGPLQGLLRTHGGPPQKAAALTLPMLRRLLATCDAGARGRRDRALLLFGFAGALRRSELVALQVEDVAIVAGGLGCASAGPRPTRPGRGPRSACRAARHAETCPARAFDAWQAVAKRKAGPLFRKISTAGRIGDAALHLDAVRRILSRPIAMAGITVEGFDRLSAHALRVGFITAAYDKGVRDEDIMRHTRHRDLRTMRGYVQRAGLVSESPAGMLDL